MEKEHLNIYTIPSNYTDSGRALGGMVETRNLIECIAILALLGYPQIRLLPSTGSAGLVILMMTLLPMAVFALAGVDGDSLFQYAGHILRYIFNRRKMHMRRTGVIDSENEK